MLWHTVIRSWCARCCQLSTANCQLPGKNRTRVNILALVPTRFNDTAGRDLLRTTWVDRTKPGWERDLDVDVETLFVIGVDIGVDTDYVTDPHLRKRSKCFKKQGFDFGPYQEMEKHHDILMLPVLDSALTLKSAAMFEWAYSNRPHADYILKIDSDTYVYWPHYQTKFPRTQERVVVGRKHPDKHTLSATLLVQFRRCLFPSLHISGADTVLWVHRLLSLAMLALTAYV